MNMYLFFNNINASPEHFLRGQHNGWSAYINARGSHRPVEGPCAKVTAMYYHNEFLRTPTGIIPPRADIHHGGWLWVVGGVETRRTPEKGRVREGCTAIWRSSDVFEIKKVILTIFAWYLVRLVCVLVDLISMIFFINIYWMLDEFNYRFNSINKHYYNQMRFI